MKHEASRKILLSASLAVVAVVLVWGFTLVGSPAFNRKLAADQNRSEDISRLARRIEEYYRNKQKLPEKLADLNTTLMNEWEEKRLDDPATNKPYEFIVNGPFTYQLCAEFELSSKDAEMEKTAYSHSGFAREHDAGRFCFSSEIPEAKRKSDP